MGGVIAELPRVGVGHSAHLFLILTGTYRGRGSSMSTPSSLIYRPTSNQWISRFAGEEESEKREYEDKDSVDGEVKSPSVVRWMRWGADTVRWTRSKYSANKGERGKSLLGRRPCPGGRGAEGGGVSANLIARKCLHRLIKISLSLVHLHWGVQLFQLGVSHNHH